MCKATKPTKEFNKNKARGDGLNTLCRKCSNERSRKYYQDNREKHLKVVRANKRRYVERNRLLIEKIKSKNGCAFCDENETCCLEFHHMDGEKDFAISNGVYGKKSSTITLLKEVKRCACVCRNCHAKIHAGLFVTEEKHRCVID